MTFAIDRTGRRALVTGAGQNVGFAIAGAMGSDPAELCVFLAGDHAERVTGHTYPVPGGYPSTL